MEAINYSQWKDTAHLLHMALQMMGKVKLERMPPQPEWKEVLLEITPQGFSTGLIPHGQSGFAISFDVGTGQIEVESTGGQQAGFRLCGGTSVCGVYRSFEKMLAHIGCATAINPTPQECANLTLFPLQTEERAYDCKSAGNYLECCTLAYNGILRFAAPFRCKKIAPSMFWGTFDLTAILFSGEEAPFSGKGGRIEREAFDEKMVEFGFWPGDTKVDEPSFYALAYPFMAAHPQGAALGTEGAFFSAEKNTYFLPLKDVLKAPDPLRAIERFCADAFAAVLAQGDWKHREWFTKPLER